MKGVMQKVQRFGGAMFTPVLLFSFAGIMVGLSTLFMNQSIFGALAAEEGIWYKIWYMIQEGAWMVFRQMPLLFAIGLPIGLAKKQNARCVLEAFTIYVTFNYFLSAILKFWGTNFGVDFAAEVGGTSGLANVCGIKTLDTGMLGALIISGVVVWIHNKYFDTELPEWLGIFSGSSFVVMIGFFVMIPMAFLFALGWPKIQEAMLFLQDFFKSSGTIGVGLYAFSEKILLPTGLHHFIYAPFALDSAVVPGGIEAYWNLHLSEFAQSTKPLRELFPAGAFHLYGTPKVFAPMGITLAFYTTAKKEKRKQVLALMIPAALGYGTTVNGGFAEYCVVNESQVYKLGTNTTFEQGAMTEPVACCLHGIDLCSIRPGHQVVVIGGGMIGLLMLQLARLAGAAKVALLEPIESKREVGKELGADICIDPIHENVKAKLKEHGMTWVNTVIECVGRPATIAQAIEIAGPKAVVMMFGLTKPEEEIAIKPFEIFQKELELKASYINPLTQKRALDLIDSGRLDVSSMVAQVCGLEKLEEILANPEARAKGKYIISPEM